MGRPTHENERQEIESAIIGDSLDFMPYPNFIHTSLVASKLDSTRSEEDAVKVMREVLIKQEKELEIIKKCMTNNALKGQAALDLAAHNKIKLREVK